MYDHKCGMLERIIVHSERNILNIFRSFLLYLQWDWKWHTHAVSACTRTLIRTRAATAVFVFCGSKKSYYLHINGYLSWTYSLYLFWHLCRIQFSMHACVPMSWRALCSRLMSISKILINYLAYILKILRSRNKLIIITNVMP